MARRSQPNHSPAFKEKAALAFMRGDRTLAELAEQFEVHPIKARIGNKSYSPGMKIYLEQA